MSQQAFLLCIESRLKSHGSSAGKELEGHPQANAEIAGSDTAAVPAKSSSRPEDQPRAQADAESAGHGGSAGRKPEGQPQANSEIAGCSSHSCRAIGMVQTVEEYQAELEVAAAMSVATGSAKQFANAMYALRCKTNPNATMAFSKDHAVVLEHQEMLQMPHDVNCSSEGDGKKILYNVPKVLKQEYERKRNKAAEGAMKSRLERWSDGGGDLHIVRKQASP